MPVPISKEPPSVVVTTVVSDHCVSLISGELKSELLSICTSYTSFVPSPLHERVNVPFVHANEVGALPAVSSVCEFPPLLCVIYPFTK